MTSNESLASQLLDLGYEEDHYRMQLTELSNKDFNKIESFLLRIEKFGFYIGLRSFFSPSELEKVFITLTLKNTPSTVLEIQKNLDNFVRSFLNTNLIPDLSNIVSEYYKSVADVTPGMFLDVKDSTNLWTLAQVVEIFEYENSYVFYIRYVNWTERYNEFISADSERLKFLYNYKNEPIFNWDNEKLKKQTKVECRIRQRQRASFWSVREFAGCPEFPAPDFAPVGTFTIQFL